MGTIDGIQTDTDYLHSTFQFLLLNDSYSNHSGSTPVIPLCHAALLSFIQVFQDLIKCQGYVRSDNRKLCTLFISNRKIIEWNQTPNASDTNIHKVYIFCGSYSDFLAMKAWTGCYQAKVQDVYLSENVEYELLKLGVDHIQKILPEFQERGLRRKFCCHAREMLKALDKYFEKKSENTDDEESVDCE